MTEEQFKQQIFLHTDYQQSMLEQFFDYWSEANKKGKMRWELEKTWDLNKRLKRWYTNQINWNNGHKQTNSTSQHDQLNSVYASIKQAVANS